jgi:hypothetical protein
MAAICRLGADVPQVQLLADESEVLMHGVEVLNRFGDVPRMPISFLAGTAVKLRPAVPWSLQLVAFRYLTAKRALSTCSLRMADIYRRLWIWNL